MYGYRNKRIYRPQKSPKKELVERKRAADERWEGDGGGGGDGGEGSSRFVRHVPRFLSF